MTDNHPPQSAKTVLPYQEITDDSNAVLAAQRFSVEEPRPGTVVLRGPCPRCDTIIDVPVVSRIFRSSRLLGIRGPRNLSSTGHVEPMMCTCEDEHPGRPEGGCGCGAYWTLVLSRHDS